MLLGKECTVGKIKAIFVAVLVIIVLALSAPAVPVGTKKKQRSEKSAAWLWRDPGDISSRDLFYGSGSRDGEPHEPFTFRKEDLQGTSPKFDVTDRDGIKWRVKLGVEARPETAAARLIWAVGYFTPDDYFLPELRVRALPTVLSRGQKYIEKDGSIRNVRLKRDPGKKIGIWHWRDNPFSGTREFNGLRVMMAVINNWDLKDVNAAVYQVKVDAGMLEKRYAISDLGASFGTASQSYSGARSKGNLEAYGASQFIENVTPDFVDFFSPGQPSPFVLVDPPLYFAERHLRWIGKHIARADAKWIGQLLGRLSPDQIRDAFRAAGYSSEEVEGFAAVVQDRIAQLNRL